MLGVKTEQEIIHHKDTKDTKTDLLQKATKETKVGEWKVYYADWRIYLR